MPEFGAPEELFDGTAWYYARYRPLYPDDAIDALVQRLRLDAGSKVVDLGCGTGQVGIPLAKRGMRVWAIDPSDEMLSEGAKSGIEGIEWLRGSDETFTSVIPPGEYDACVVGAAFHWMRRDQVLAKLDGVIASRGGVAILANEVSAWSLETTWATACRDVIREFLGTERRAGSGTYTNPPESHPAVLQRSAFPQVEVLRFATAMQSTVDEIVGLQLSSSYASPALLGDRIDTFRDTLRARLADIAPSGSFDWTMGKELIVATR